MSEAEQEVIRVLEHRLEATEDDETKQRIRDALAERKGFALTGDGHGREGVAETS